MAATFPKAPWFMVLVAWALNVVWVEGAKAEPGLWATLQASHQAGQKLSYTGLLVSQSGRHVYTSRLLQQVQGAEQFEMLERLDGQDWRWLRLNNTMQTVQPDKKRIVQEERKAPLSPMLFTHVLSGSAADANLSALYTIQEQPSQRVAGRIARVLLLNPKDKLRHAYRLAIDPSKQLVLRTELLDAEGEPLESVGFSEIEFSAPQGPLPRLLEPTPGWSMVSVLARQVEQAELPYVLPETLHGFWRVETLLRQKPNAAAVYQTVYTDGLSRVSVFVQPNTAWAQTTSLGAALSKTEILGPYRVTVLGEVPEKTLSLLLRSVQFKPPIKPPIAEEK